MNNIHIIYGPAGTGKTTRLLKILQYTLDEGFKPEEIAYVTFSKKATLEVQARLSQATGIETKRFPHFRTIHSMCFQALGATTGQMMNRYKYEDFGRKSGFALKGYINMEEGLSFTDDDYIGLDHLYRNNRKQFDKMSGEINNTKFVQFLKLYNQYRKTFGYLDFNDLLELYLHKQIIQPVKVAIIDEAQDLTSLQWRVCMQAFKDVEKTYIAGDDDQAVYTWAGGDVDVFLNLSGTTETLGQSYRLSKKMVQAANKVTKLIRNRVKKEYDGLTKDSTIEHINSLAELELDENSTYYMLARNNYLLSHYEDLLQLAGLPYNIKGVSSIPSDWYTQKPDEKAENYSYYHMLVANGNLHKDPSRITLSSIHGVKGGEADQVVLLTDMSKKTQKSMEVDEDSEHRVWYVGVTRTKTGLTIVLPQTKNSYPFLGRL